MRARRKRSNQSFETFFALLPRLIIRENSALFFASSAEFVGEFGFGEGAEGVI
jgi:hypothetical protein